MGKVSSELFTDEGQFQKYFHVLPNIYDDDLDPYEYRLMGHYKRVGYSWQGTRKIAGITKMSTGKVSSTRKSLLGKGLIRVEMLTRKELKDRGCYIPEDNPDNKNKISVTSIVDVTLENILRYTKDEILAARIQAVIADSVHAVNTGGVHEVNADSVHGVNVRINPSNSYKNNPINTKDSAPSGAGGASEADENVLAEGKDTQTPAPDADTGTAHDLTPAPDEPQPIRATEPSTAQTESPLPPSVPPVSPTPKFNLEAVFDCVAWISFGIKDMAAFNEAEKLLPKSKRRGGRIGEIKKWLMAHYAPAGLGEKYIADYIQQFYKWYRKQYKDVSVPRDVGKFSTAWLEWEQRDIPAPSPTSPASNNHGNWQGIYPSEEAYLADLRQHQEYMRNLQTNPPTFGSLKGGVK